MTNITKLADKWRIQANNFPICDHVIYTYADELEAALPTWTRVTSNYNSRPPQDVWVLRSRGGRLSSDMGAWLNVGDWWRPLTGYDRPPK